MLTLTPEQNEAMSAITDWYHNDGSSLTLGGFAGTGKTTMLGMLQDVLPDTKIRFVSYTGKAVSVLRKKLPPGSETSTIHRLLYHPRRELLCIESGEVVPYVGGKCMAHEGKTKKLAFHLASVPTGNDPEPEDTGCETKSNLNWSLIDNPLFGIDLVVVDEASMVSEKIWYDLTRWGVPVLAVGDHAQLPPIKSSFSLMANPDLRLEKILRQAAESPIIQMSIQARTQGHINPGDYGQGCRTVPMHQRFRVPMYPGNGDLVICGYNRTRNELNDFYRRKAGHKGAPEAGDCVICLRNNYEAGVFNGLRGTIKSYEELPQKYWVKDTIAFADIQLMDDDTMFAGEISVEQFGQPKTLSDIPRRLTLFDYGYAMTAHKSQGSQADSVLVIEERLPRTDDEQHARWLYTSVTRAAERVVVAMR